MVPEKRLGRNGSAKNDPMWQVRQNDPCGSRFFMLMLHCFALSNGELATSVFSCVAPQDPNTTQCRTEPFSETFFPYRCVPENIAADVYTGDGFH